MAPGRSLKNLVDRRRRTKGDDEDEDSVAEDSQSDVSMTSDLDEYADADDDADASGMSDTDTTEPTAQDHGQEAANDDASNGGPRSKRTRKAKKVRGQGEAQNKGPEFANSADTEAMLNGFKDGTTDGPAIDFEATGVQDANETQTAGAGRRGTANVADRRRREHEEYKKKRDTDPTFIPNRGGFFMHDARIPDQRGFSSFARGRGRGRGVVGPHIAQGSYATSAFSKQGYKTDSGHSQMPQTESASDTNWKHDLHETVNAPNASSKPSHSLHDSVLATDNGARGPSSAPARPLNFSKTTQIGKVQIRVVLPGNKAPILFSDVPVKSHARLPDHRPPLRRDKPVRISLPDIPPRYRFPSAERSFIFIPRAMRPNQQGFGRARGSFGAYGAPASRRTSVYGGSVYSPSVSMSRRSSLARDVPRDSAFSPTGSYVGRPPQANRPAVRLPHPGSRRSSNASPAGSVSAYGRGQPYPLPQKPAVEHWAEPATMYQPRPQKTISVTGIESPAGMSLHAPQQQDQQPFHNQLPQHMGENAMSPQHGLVDMAQQQYYPQPYAYPGGGASTGTPLSNIPERAIHAQPFQPVPAFYPQYPTQAYYYPPQGPQYPAMPVYAPPVHTTFGAPDGIDQPGPADPNQSQQGMVAYETNGMVYYQDTTNVPQYPPQDAYYQAPVYGMGGMMTPGPEAANYYYPQVPAGPVYYSQN